MNIYVGNLALNVSEGDLQQAWWCSALGPEPLCSTGLSKK